MQDSKKITIDEKTFFITIKRFANGCFLAISDGETIKLGAIELSIKVKDQTNSSTIIPPRFSGTFLTMVSEMAANITNGIALVSIHLTKEISTDIAKSLLSEARTMLSTQKS